MEISDDLLCLFSAEIDEHDDSYTITIPEREMSKGDIDSDEAYRVAVIESVTIETDNPEPEPSTDQGQKQTGSSSVDQARTESSGDGQSRDNSSGSTNPQTSTESSNQSRTHSKSPVAVGDRRTVEIEDIGEQGDGVARVERGYVIIIPETEKRERVTIEITDVAQNVAFGTVVERKAYYE